MSYLENDFQSWLGQNPDIPFAVREFIFAPPRKFRFDFAWPDQKVAVEIEGGLWKGGRHQTLDGFMKDCEKYERALQLGWRVYRVPGPWVSDGSRWIWREEVMTTLRMLLEVK